jgi:hypothetical protein
MKRANEGDDMTANKPMTAAALRSIFSAAGASDATVEVALRLTAPARHEARVQSAMRAALEYAARCTGSEAEPGAVEAMLRAIQDDKWGADLPRPNCLLAGDCWALAAAAYCAAEAWVGAGGPAGAGGPGRGTDRALWAQGLGKGRYWASDGAAWCGALADASKMLAQAAGAPGGFITLEPASQGLRAGVPNAPEVSTLLTFDLPAQAYALCVRGLAGALPAEAPHRLDPLDPEANLRFAGALDEWARTLDYVGRAGADASIPEGIDEDGLRRLVSIGEPFNPWLNQAVAVRLETLRRG